MMAGVTYGNGLSGFPVGMHPELYYAGRDRGYKFYTMWGMDIRNIRFGFSTPSGVPCGPFEDPEALLAAFRLIDSCDEQM